MLLNIVQPENLRLILPTLPYPQKRDNTWNIANRNFTDYDLFVVFGGTVLIVINNLQYELREGMAVLAQPQVIFSAFYKGPGDLILVAQHFDLKLFNKIDFLSLIHINPVITFKHWEFVKSCYEKYVSVAHQNKKLQAHSLFSVILTEFLNEAYLSDKIETDSVHFNIIKIADTINNNLQDDDITRKALASISYTPDHAAALFKKYIGITPKKYFLQARLQRSKELLFKRNSAGGWLRANVRLRSVLEQNPWAAVEG